MKLTARNHIDFTKGYQAQHDDMFADLKEHFSDIQGTMLDYDFNSENDLDFEDFGREACIYKLEQYCKQARLLRDAKGLTNYTVKGN